MALSDPASFFRAITPNDNEPLPSEARGIYVGGSGDLTVKNRLGQVVTFSGAVAGTVLPIVVTHVMASGTTATELVSLE